MAITLTCQLANVVIMCAQKIHIITKVYFTGAIIYICTYRKHLANWKLKIKGYSKTLSCMNPVQNRFALRKTLEITKTCDYYYLFNSHLYTSYIHTYMYTHMYVYEYV